MARVTPHIFMAVTGVFLGIIMIALVVLSVSPAESKAWQFALIYAGAFILTFGVFTLSGYALRVILWPKGLRHQFSRSAARQALLFGALAVAVLILQSQRVFNFWSAGLLLIFFVLIELYVQ